MKIIKMVELKLPLLMKKNACTYITGWFERGDIE